jgi:hypothetical protein
VAAPKYPAKLQLKPASKMLTSSSPPKTTEATESRRTIYYFFSAILGGIRRFSVGKICSVYRKFSISKF